MELVPRDKDPEQGAVCAAPARNKGAVEVKEAVLEQVRQGIVSAPSVGHE